ncbi:hypothetical protein NPIL_701161 [Nephila pilipes]|uniref:Uncharacterized protein n=1 Tax=Nephila pilipes TaxID=299642 RepID=A0A8X6T6I5_NEPPI|nr:hypothetical protein NPIL_701161 [Nephila pilipes]
MDKSGNSSEEVSEFSCIDLCELDLEEAYHKVDSFNDAKSSEKFCDLLVKLIYYNSKLNSDQPDLKLISETQHIIIRCALKSNKLLFVDLKYYLQQILENVRQQPTATFPPPSQDRKKKTKRALTSPVLANKDSKKSKRVDLTDLSDNVSKTMNSALPPPHLDVRAKMTLSLLKQIPCLHLCKLRKIKRVKLRITTALPSSRKIIEYR